MSLQMKAVAQDDDATARVRDADWGGIARELDQGGYAVIRGEFDPAACASTRAMYAQEHLFRSRVVMARHGFGQGEYQYFAYPLPVAIERLRQALYERLAPIANGWSDALGSDARYPAGFASFLDRCHENGQSRPTPLLLKYGPGDHNRLHQDLYGGIQFPLQAAVLLSAPGSDFDGGEFVLTETAPRRQSRAEVVPLKQGDMAIFAVNQRPVRSARGFARVVMRHGVSAVRRGERYTLGIILHDAT